MGRFVEKAQQLINSMSRWGDRYPKSNFVVPVIIRCSTHFNVKSVDLFQTAQENRKHEPAQAMRHVCRVPVAGASRSRYTREFPAEESTGVNYQFKKV